MPLLVELSWCLLSSSPAGRHREPAPPASPLVGDLGACVWEHQEVAGEFAQDPGLQAPGGGHGQPGLPWPVRLQGQAGVRVHRQGRPPSPCRPPCQQWAGPGSGPLRVPPAMGGPGTWGPFGSQAAVPHRPILGRQSHLSEDTFSSSTQGWRRDRRAFLGTHNVLNQVGKSPCSWSQQLVSACGGRRATRSTLPGGGPGGQVQPPYTFGRGVAAWFRSQLHMFPPL